VSNGGNSDYNREYDLSVYDKFPRKLRDLLKDTPRNITSVQIYSIRKRYGLDAQELTEEIEQRVESFRKEWMRETWNWAKGIHPNFPT